TYANRIDPLQSTDPNAPLSPVLPVNDQDNARSTKLLQEITYTVGGVTSGSVGGSADPQLAGNNIEMEKAYAARLDNLDFSYYTYSYYGVDANGDKALEAVAMRRLNQDDATIPVGSRPQVANANLLESGEYLTAANWNAYRQSFGLTGTVAFTDANVSAFIASQFNQTLRSNTNDITAPLISGLRVSHKVGATVDYTATADIQSFTDDAGFLLPESVKINKVTDNAITVTNAYVTGKDAASARTVNYDSVLGLNQYGLWFGGVENVDLNVNDTASASTNSNTVNVKSTRYITDLVIDTGGGADAIDIGRQTAIGAATPVWLLGSVESDIYIGGGAGTDTVTVKDSSDTTGRTAQLVNGTLSNGASGDLFGAGGAVHFFTGTTPTLSVEAISIALGSGADVFTVNDTTSILSTTPVSLTTDGGADTLTIVNSNTLLTLDTGDQDDLVRVQAISAALTVRTGNQNDIINIGSDTTTFGDNSGSADLITATLTIEAGAGIDVVNVDDGADGSADAATLSATNNGGVSDSLILAGLSGGTINSKEIESLTAYLGTSNNVVNVQSTLAAASVRVVGRNGGGTYNVGSDTTNLTDASGVVTGIRSRVEIFAGSGVLERQQLNTSGFTGTVSLSITDPDDSSVTLNSPSVALNAQAIQDALNGSGMLGAGAVTVTGSGPIFDIAFNRLGNFAQIVTSAVVSSTTTTQGAVAVKEQQLLKTFGFTGNLQLTIPNPADSSATLVTGSISLGGSLATNAANIQAALNNVSVLGAGAVTVTVVGSDYNVAFNSFGNFGDISSTGLAVSTPTDGLIDQLNFDDRGFSGGRVGNANTVGTASISGFGMTGPGLVFTGLEDLRLGLGSGADKVYIADTHAGTVTVDTGGGNDSVAIRGISGATRVEGGAGADRFMVNFEADGTTQTFENNIRAELWLSGRADGDQYFVGLAGSGSSRINIQDKSPNGDRGVNALTVYGTD